MHKVGGWTATLNGLVKLASWKSRCEGGGLSLLEIWGKKVPGRGPKAGESKECWRNGMAGVWGERGNTVGTRSLRSCHRTLWYSEYTTKKHIKIKGDYQAVISDFNVYKIPGISLRLLFLKLPHEDLFSRSAMGLHSSWPAGIFRCRWSTF